MDEICTALSNKIFSCTQNGYGVFYEDELLDVLPESERNRDTLEAALKKLVKGGYLDVKYAKGSAFCMSGIKLYEPPKEDLPSPAAVQPVVQKVISDKKVLAFAFLAAFIGAVLGSLLCGLILYAF